MTDILCSKCKTNYLFNHNDSLCRKCKLENPKLNIQSGSFNIPELLSNSETLDQIAKTILKNHNEKPLSTLLNEFENDIDLKSDSKDTDNLLSMPQTKSKLDLDTIEKMTQKQKKEFLIQSEKKNLKVLAKIKQKLKENLKKDPLDNTYGKLYKQILQQTKDYFSINGQNYYSESDLRIDINSNLVRQLKIIMNKIRSQKVKSYSQKGKKPIINRFIQAKYGSTRDIFSTKKAVNHLTFNFVVDQSGSMGSDTLRVAELIKTFFKAVNDIQEIKINVIGYEGSNLNIVLNKENELNRIAYSGGGTPSGQALTYASDLIKKQNGKNVLIFMSDGSPNGIGSGKISTEKYIKFVIDDLKKSKRIDSFGILVGGGYAFRKFSQIFGSDFSQFENLESAESELIKIFNTFVDDYLRSF